jgi:HlyD family secretion protein
MQTAQGQQETFELEIALEKTYIQTQNKRVVLNPGQTATAEVIVRQRRLIDFILDPFKKLLARRTGTVEQPFTFTFVHLDCLL